MRANCCCCCCCGDCSRPNCSSEKPLDRARAAVSGGEPPKEGKEAMLLTELQGTTASAARAASVGLRPRAAFGSSVRAAPVAGERRRLTAWRGGGSEAAGSLRRVFEVVLTELMVGSVTPSERREEERARGEER